MDTKKLVEDTFELGGQQRITFLVHSMGGPMTLVFLQNQTPAWKDKYIEQVISLAGAYGMYIVYNFATRMWKIKIDNK